MFNRWPDIFQVGVKGEAFEITPVRLRKRAREMSIILECVDIHEVGLYAWANLFAKLGKNIEAAIVHI